VLLVEDRVEGRSSGWRGFGTGAENILIPINAGISDLIKFLNMRIKAFAHLRDKVVKCKGEIQIHWIKEKSGLCKLENRISGEFNSIKV